MINVKNMDTGAGDPLQFYTNRYDLERLIVNPNYENDGIQFIWESYQNWVNQAYRFNPAPEIVDNYGVDFRVIFKFVSADATNDPGPFGTLMSPHHTANWAFDDTNQTFVVVGSQQVVNEVLGSMFFIQDPEWSVDVIGGFYIDITVGDINTAFQDLEYHQLVLTSSYENNYSLARADECTKFALPRPTKRKSTGSVKKKVAYSTTYRANGFTRRLTSKVLHDYPITKIKPNFAKKSGLTTTRFVPPAFTFEKSKPTKTIHADLYRSSIKYRKTVQTKVGVPNNLDGRKVIHTSGFNPVDSWVKTGKHSLIIPVGPAQEFTTHKVYNDYLKIIGGRKYRTGALSNPGRLQLSWAKLTKSANPMKRVLNARFASNHTLMTKAGLPHSHIGRIEHSRLFTLLPVVFGGISLTQYVREKFTSKTYAKTSSYVPYHTAASALSKSIVITHIVTALKWNRASRKLYMGYTALNARPNYHKPSFNYGSPWTGKTDKVVNVPFYFIPFFDPPFGRYSGGITNVFAYKFTGRISG